MGEALDVTSPQGKDELMQEVVHDEVRRSIAVAFDAHDPKQAALLHGFVSSFGERYVKVEDLDPPRRRCLLVYPGGAREARE